MNAPADPSIFWIVTSFAGVLLSIVAFLIKYLFADVRGTLQIVSKTMSEISAAHGVFNAELSHQRTDMGMLREDFKQHVEHILKEYDSVSEEIDALRDKQVQLQHEIHLLAVNLENCQKNCSALQRQ